MKKIAFLLVLVLVISMPLSVMAVEPRIVVRPELSFSGTTAHCGISVRGSNTYDYLVVALKLYNGYQLVDQWSKAGNGRVSMDETCTVTKGVTYRLVAEVMINGTSHPSGSATGTC